MRDGAAPSPAFSWVRMMAPTAPLKLRASRCLGMGVEIVRLVDGIDGVCERAARVGAEIVRPREAWPSWGPAPGWLSHLARRAHCTGPPVTRAAAGPRRALTLVRRCERKPPAFTERGAFLAFFLRSSSVSGRGCGSHRWHQLL